MTKLWAYYTISKAEMNRLEGEDKSKYKGKPPSQNPKILEDASSVEVLSYPGDESRCFLYIVWPDGCKYLQAWSVVGAKLALGSDNKKLFIKKQRVWSRDLQKKLLKDSKLNV